MLFSMCKYIVLGKVHAYPLCYVKVPSTILSSFFDGLRNVQISTYPTCKALGINYRGNFTTLLS